ncbi:stress-induced-phosphoprotein 1 [Trypanosoma conorhini]|uniref:Stress-induced-phosphoprotein 1 n=1 Tax=Trypanosoma conorhini TaxID=83891 RepID=A0A3R7PNG3_9TRYP|nr:stress-induced-phosphoprotein 1 [Trypanosoma conorhini]RNF22694.1 stress-induced-phosphoprotein 1 [Trypanosoma conorhini]
MVRSKEHPLPDELRGRLEQMDGGATAEAWKLLGNECFSHGCYLSAIRCYTKALEKDETAVLHSSRSAAYLKSSMFAGPSLALKDAERAVELDPAWYKARLRVGDAQFARKKYAEAKAAYQKALELDGNCTTAADSLRLAERELFLRSLDEQARQEAANGGPSEGSTNSTLNGNTGTTSTKSSSAQPPTAEEEINQHIQLWAQDTTMREDRTAMRAFNARLDEADREAGARYKSELLSNFRGRMATQEPLRRKVEERQEQELRMGEGIDYRNADSYRATLIKGTNGVGLGISTDAYKSYKYESKMW